MVQILGEHESSVKKMLDEFGVYLKPSTFGKDVKPFLKDACSQIFGSATGLVDMMIAHVPSSKASAANKVSRKEKKRTGKTLSFGVKSMRSQVLYRAAWHKASSIAGVHDLVVTSAQGFTHPHRLIESVRQLQIYIGFHEFSISRGLLSNSRGGIFFSFPGLLAKAQID